MARIPDEELQRIKSQVTVEDLCRDYGIELHRMGPDNLMGRWPAQPGCDRAMMLRFVVFRDRMRLPPLSHL